MKGIVLFDADPQRRAELFLNDELGQVGIDAVRIRAERSRWHFEGGVRIGMTLAELVHANGAVISFGGLD